MPIKKEDDVGGEISLKVICENVQISTGIIAIIFVTMNGHTSCTYSV